MGHVLPIHRLGTNGYGCLQLSLIQYGIYGCFSIVNSLNRSHGIAVLGTACLLPIYFGVNGR